MTLIVPTPSTPTITGVPATTSYTTTPSGLFVPTRATPTQFSQPLVTAKEMTTGEILTAVKQAQSDLAKAEGADFAQFKLGDAVELAARVDSDARRAALIELLKANQIKG